MDRSDTIAAVATAPGRGGVAVVRVSGPDALQVAARVSGRAPEPGRVVYTEFRGPASCGARRPLLDKGLLLCFKAPRSYTGEDVAEFHCHGGTVAPRRVLEAAICAGARLARRGEFTERAFLNGKLGYEQAEAVLDLVDAKTSRAADAALADLAGGGDAACAAAKGLVGGLYDQALELSSEVEHALDVDEGDLPEGFLDALAARVRAFARAVDEAIRRLRERRMLREGALVVLAGPPNAGKSSLLNALLGSDRAIVSATPGTTRDAIEAWADFGGWPVRLVDTAGLRRAEDGEDVGEVEAEGIRRSEALASRADVVVWLDGGAGAPPPAQALAVHSKCDLSRGDGLNVSSVTGEGLDELRAAVAARLEALAARGDEPADDGEARLAALLEVRAIVADLPADLVLAGNVLRRACEKLGSLAGATYSADLLDRLFSRFCVGK